MKTRYLLFAALFGLAACATPGPTGPAVNDGAAGYAAGEDIPTAAADSLEVAEVPVVPIAASASPPQNELVCRKVRSVGSNIPKKVCRTRAQLEADRESGQETLDALSRRTFSGPNQGSINE